MERSTEDKKLLRDAAKRVISGKEEQYQIDRYETTGKDSGEGAFPSEVEPEVWTAEIDMHSDSGYVQISGGGLEARIYRTGPDETTGEYVTNRFEDAEIYPGQMCMIFGRSTVLYIRPRKKKGQKHK